jgi:hypothetical protein
VTAQYDKLSGNTTGIKNLQSNQQVNATFNWWGSSTGPGSSGSSGVAGPVQDSPWLGDTKSLTLATPDSLGFASALNRNYVVTPSTAGLNLGISLGGKPVGTVTAGGTIVFTGKGGGVTVNGQSGTGFNTDAFTITNAAVNFAAADAFKGSSIQFKGSTSRTIAAKGTANTFNVSGWTGTGTLKAPAGKGTVVASKNAGYTLTDSELSCTDGMALSLSGITKANLTAKATSGNPSMIINASAFTGRTNLVASGTGNAILFGGSGNGGKLTATGSGDDILIGGSGSDALTDLSTGYGILIGGGGADTITGNGQDILISGTTSYDSNIAALDAILAEWSSTDSYATRITNISIGITVGSNTYAWNATTVQSDGVTNTVNDGNQASQSNWFIVSSLDRVTRKSNETETIIH